jgi:hypothetical protein
MDIENNINIVCRQTDYDYDKAKEKLQLYDNCIENVINDYLGINAKKNEPVKKSSINQMIYSEIRTLMDDSIKNYEKNKAK